jgi:hypothetical protein
MTISATGHRSESTTCNLSLHDMPCILCKAHCGDHTSILMQCDKIRKMKENMRSLPTGNASAELSAIGICSSLCRMAATVARWTETDLLDVFAWIQALMILKVWPAEDTSTLLRNSVAHLNQNVLYKKHSDRADF